MAVFVSAPKLKSVLMKRKSLLRALKKNRNSNIEIEEDTTIQIWKLLNTWDDYF